MQLEFEQPVVEMEEPVQAQLLLALLLPVSCTVLGAFLCFCCVVFSPKPSPLQPYTLKP